MRPIERRRESWDKEHRWLLGAGSDLQPTASEETGNSHGTEASFASTPGVRRRPSPSQDGHGPQSPQQLEGDTSTAAR